MEGFSVGMIVAPMVLVVHLQYGGCYIYNVKDTLKKHWMEMVQDIYSYLFREINYYE